MSDQRCRTCRWWCDAGEDAYKLRHLMPHDETYQPIDDGTLRFCESPKLRFFERPEPGGATVIDGSEYFGRLVTTDAFGCVNWEGQPPPNV